MITGAAGGIGAETCKLFAKNGLRGGVRRISAGKAEKALLAETSAYGRRGRRSSLQNAMKARRSKLWCAGCVEAFGRVDVL